MFVFMIQLISATLEEIPIIQQIAYQTWPNTFRDILSEAQIAYMLDMMYSDGALQKQLHELGHQYLLAKKADHYLGYLSFENNYQHQPQTKIHKIYILPEAQGLGIGKALMDATEKQAIAKGSRYLLLNVNKYNKAVQFYQRLGFEVIATEDIDIGAGFLMEDKVMRKTLNLKNQHA